ncbi:F-type H+-transporting ATPase subunit gamma [Pseudorhodobacter antarcticus]|jgi:F-type H+-transporting ATPase subunit gamma|uniref:F-type H+-transporting ATPase subunit gamma n=1 Tax=Pseudorhodobacter antarcticus TaxID=1077947 RepID=A0A1H8JZ70_9RHOB|nr:FoF1 ATP synthase subunit gamma [Pseudorhodobacter antarcticus]SEN85566.1 F-type H+-transporting ATPase subunit gamma [Pseudorhodobacter antarcticus]
MTERLADITARVESISALGSVVNAMKGIAAARARMARTQLGAVEAYAATVAAAMASVLGPTHPAPPMQGKTGILLFCAEQGFAGAFSERVLDSVAQDPAAAFFLIGTRGLSVATARGTLPGWHAAMPSHTRGIPKLADQITKAIFAAVSVGQIDRLDVVFTGWQSGRGVVQRAALFPLDLSDLPKTTHERPLTQLPTAALIDALGADYVHALVCKAALNAFAAENEARIEAMTAAGSQIARELKHFQATLQRVRQEAITAEIIELGTGVA